MIRLLLLFTILFSPMAQAAPLKSAKDTQDFTVKIMKLFLSENFSEGLNVAKEHWPLPAVEIDGLANQIKTQWPMVQQRFGRPTGVELVKKEKIGNSFLQYYYLHKFENHAIYWKIGFYKPKTVWIINGISFQDDIDILYTTK